jgi:hypothetical protein
VSNHGNGQIRAVRACERSERKMELAAAACRRPTLASGREEWAGERASGREERASARAGRAGQRDSHVLLSCLRARDGASGGGVPTTDASKRAGGVGERARQRAGRAGPPASALLLLRSLRSGPLPYLTTPPPGWPPRRGPGRVRVARRPVGAAPPPHR